jgi:hypothetical protein
MGVSTDISRVPALRLAPFERFMLADDSTRHPMCFIVELWLRGTLDRQAFTEAAYFAHRRHPLLSSLVDANAVGRGVWVDVDARPFLDWAAEGEPCVCPSGESIDLRREVGLRIWVREGEATARVLLQFHHAACDGLGAFQYVEDLLAAYDCLVQRPGIEPELRPLEPTRLTSRAIFTAPAPQEPLPPIAFGDRLRGVALGVKETVRLLTRRADPVAAPTQPQKSRPFLEYHVHTLEQDEFRRLRRAATAAEATLNDLLLRDLFLALRNWNAQHGAWSDRSQLRILMPLSMRTKGDELLPAANRISYGFLTREARDVDSADSLLEGVRNETRHILRANLGQLFIGGISLLPSLQKPMLTVFGRGCMATAVMTNPGDPTRRFTHRFRREEGELVAGNVRLEKITGVPPLRHETRAAFSVVPMAGRLSLSAKCDPGLFTTEESRAVLDLFVERLRSSMTLVEN